MTHAQVLNAQIDVHIANGTQYDLTGEVLRTMADDIGENTVTLIDHEFFEITFNDGSSVVFNND